MWNTIMAFKDSVIDKFGPVLGYAILIIGGLIAFSVLGILIKLIFNIMVGLIVAAIIFLGAYKIYELLKSKR